MNPSESFARAQLLINHLAAVGIVVALLTGCGGGGGNDHDPIDTVSAPVINDTTGFALPAGLQLAHRLQSLAYVNSTGQRVDLVMTVTADERLADAGPDGAAVMLELQAGPARASANAHAVSQGGAEVWRECIELRATAEPGASVEVHAIAQLMDSATLTSKNVSMSASAYRNGDAPKRGACE